MEIPNNVLEKTGLTEEQVIEVIMDAAKKIGPRYSFGYYDAEDMVSEATIIGFKGLKKYKSGPLKNFISVHMSNRLKNFMRDNYYRPGAANAEIKMALMNMLDISNIDDESESSMQMTSDIVKIMSYKEMSVMIDAELPVSMRTDYLKMRDGAETSVSPKRRKEIIELIRKIVDSNN